ncbi:MAG: hypothetical protein Q8P67_19540, partial [archaeon]|nr:hypothetical protein [archaeon]
MSDDVYAATSSGGFPRLASDDVTSRKRPGRFAIETQTPISSSSKKKKDRFDPKRPRTRKSTAEVQQIVDGLEEGISKDEAEVARVDKIFQEESENRLIMPASSSSSRSDSSSSNLLLESLKGLRTSINKKLQKSRRVLDDISTALEAVKASEKTVEQLSEEEDRRKAVIEPLQKQLEELQQRATQLEAEVADLTKRLNTSEDALSAANARIFGLQSSVEALTGQRDEVVQEIEFVSEASEELERELSKARSVMQNRLEQLEALNSAKIQAEELAENRLEKLRELNAKGVQQNALIRTLREEIAALNARLAPAEQKAQELDRRIAGANAAITPSQQQQFQAERARLQKTIEEKNTELVEIREIRKSASELAEENRSLIASKNAEIEALKKQVEDIRAGARSRIGRDAEAATSKIQELTTTIANLQESINEAKRLSAENENEIRDLTLQRTATTAERDEARQSLSTLTTQYNAAMENVRRLESEKEAQNREIQRLRDQ